MKRDEYTNITSDFTQKLLSKTDIAKQTQSMDSKTDLNNRTKMTAMLIYKFLYIGKQHQQITSQLSIIIECHKFLHSTRLNIYDFNTFIMCAYMQGLDEITIQYVHLYK